MNKQTDKSFRLNRILEKIVDHKKVFDASFAIKQNDEIWYGAAGKHSKEQNYFIASVTKLFTSAIILHLRSKGQLNLNDKIRRYLDASILKDLMLYKGKDYSDHLNILHLLSHTSGIPDYFQGKSKNGKSLENELINGNDQPWTFEQAINRSKTMTASFAPGTKGKAQYSDTNYQLLGKIIENISQKSFANVCNDLIIKPLQLTQTYLYEDSNDKRPRTFYYKNQALHIPKAMTSFGPDGGIVSTPGDMLLFIEAFFSGQLFSKLYIQEIQQWNKISFPFQYGIGIQRFSLPWILNPLGSIPRLIGHAGLSGSVAFYSPKDNLYIVGTINQTAFPDKAFNTMIKLIKNFNK